jgi:hypothetical protein
MRIHNTEIFYRVRYCYHLLYCTYVLKYRKKLLTCTSAGLEAGSPHPAEQDKIKEIKKNLKK